MGLFKSLFDVATDVVRIGIAPAEIAVDVTRSVTKPIADLAEQTADGIKEITNPDKPERTDRG